MGIEDLLPPCPVFILLKKSDVKVEKLQVYSLTSQSCNDCKKNDNACAVYLDWLGSQPVTRLATYKDGVVGI